MTPFKILSEMPITSKEMLQYNGLAFDGCNYYVTVYDCCEILEFNNCFEPVYCHKTCRAYNGICYDPCDCCFWATVECSKMLYKLDSCLNEIDCICVKDCDVCGGTVVGVSYDCSDDTLLVALPTGVIKVCKNDGKCKIIKKLRGGWLTGILSLPPYFITTSIAQGKQYITLYSDCGTKIKEWCLPGRYKVEAIAFAPTLDKCGDCRCEFALLVSKKGCYYYFIKCDFQRDDLGFDLDLCPCNFELCKHCRCRCEQAHHPCCCHKTDIMESIALIETSLAHILNAEGEKLQKVIASTDDVNEILCVNKAVNQTIVNVAHLETILYDKLNASKGNCQDCDKHCD